LPKDVVIEFVVVDIQECIVDVGQAIIQCWPRWL
jgi:hypothetical protein